MHTKIRKNSKECEQEFADYCKLFYWNASCTSKKDFFDDLKRFKNISKLFKKYEVHRCPETLKENLIINHILVLRNVFTEKKVVELLFMRVEKKYHSFLYTFLLYLNFDIKEYGHLKNNAKIMKKLQNLNYKL